MSASLVGSEMCIRDSWLRMLQAGLIPLMLPLQGCAMSWHFIVGTAKRTCLLYTSDAADDM
eukprot:1592718-Alexandrium_andersonii.AAC.1